tara:strand:- start:18741 stop:18977 length:237 start_codon:yes stop_codon:yes gene_type:complete
MQAVRQVLSQAASLLSAVQAPFSAQTLQVSQSSISSVETFSSAVALASPASGAATEPRSALAAGMLISAKRAGRDQQR